MLPSREPDQSGPQMTKRKPPKKPSHWRLPGTPEEGSDGEDTDKTPEHRFMRLNPSVWSNKNRNDKDQNIWDDNPNLPPHLKRKPGETLAEQEDRIAAYLNARAASSHPSPHVRPGRIYDEDKPVTTTYRECGACNGNGRYNGHPCINCFGTGSIRRR